MDPVYSTNCFLLIDSEMARDFSLCIPFAIGQALSAYDVSKNKSIELKTHLSHKYQVHKDPPHLTHPTNTSHISLLCSWAIKQIDLQNEKFPLKKAVVLHKSWDVFSRKAVRRHVKMWNLLFMKLFDRFEDNEKERGNNH